MRGGDVDARGVRTLVADIGVMTRESEMAMATIGSLRDDEITAPTACDGWTRAHLVAHLAWGADAAADLAEWAATGGDPPEPGARGDRDAAVEAAVGRPAAALAADLRRADARLLAALRALRGGAAVQTVPSGSGEVSVWSLPARRTAEVLVHHADLATTWEWHEADPDGLVDGIEVCVERLAAHPDAPGLHVVAREGEEWVVGDGAHRVEGFYETLLPFLARGETDGLRHDGELPRLPAW